jgi:hypothetical protein
MQLSLLKCNGVHSSKDLVLKLTTSLGTHYTNEGI